MKYIIFALIIFHTWPAWGQPVQWQQSGNNYTTERLAIGTSSIGKRLEVRADENDHVAYFRNAHTSGYGLYLAAANDPLRIVPYAGGGNYLFVVNGLGNVGVGINAPQNRLSVFGHYTGTQVTTAPVGKFVNSGNDYAKLVVGSDNSRYDAVFSMDNNATLANTKLRMYIGNGTQATPGHNNDQFVLAGSGNVGIGTAVPDAKLTVNGGIHAEEILITVEAPSVPDYVFAPGYQLPTLEEIKTFVDQNKHLPEVPSAEEMAADGLNVGEMNMMLLKKVEELTLYLIEQQKKMNEMNDVILKQNGRIADLEHSIKK